MKTKWTKLHAEYNEKSKAIIFDDSIFSHIPNHTYYMCKELALDNNLDVQKVIYSNYKDREYRLEELRGVFDWEDINKKGRN